MENFLILKWLMEELAVFIRSDRVHDPIMAPATFAPPALLYGSPWWTERCWW